MSFEGILMWALAIAAALGGAMLVVALRGAAASEIALAAAAGRFADALEAASRRPPEARDDLLAAAIAAKHRQSFEQAADWLRALLNEDPSDGEALVELGLVETYRGRSAEADARLREAAAQRADLGESILLHRAFALLAGGEAARARSLFEEVEAPLETKLAVDVGPGEPAFAEWFLHAAALWRAGGNSERAAWAWRQAEESAPESLLPQQVETLLSRQGFGREDGEDGAGGGAR
jgi:tetratricopeptide (TPR) repeat protein